MRKRLQSGRGSQRGALDHDSVGTACSLKEPMYARFSRVLELRTEDAVSFFDPHSIDLLRIDGSREVERVTPEFDAWLSRMSSYGLVLIDCVARRGGNLGVSELWEVLSARYPELHLRPRAGARRACGRPGRGSRARGPGERRRGRARPHPAFLRVRGKDAQGCASQHRTVGRRIRPDF